MIDEKHVALAHYLSATGLSVECTGLDNNATLGSTPKPYSTYYPYRIEVKGC